MKNYFIKKVIQAKSLAEAVKKERDGEITDVWIENKDKKKQLPSAIGFTAEPIDDEFDD